MTAAMLAAITPVWWCSKSSAARDTASDYASSEAREEANRQRIPVKDRMWVRSWSRGARV